MTQQTFIIIYFLTRFGKCVGLQQCPRPTPVPAGRTSCCLGQTYRQVTNERKNQQKPLGYLGLLDSVTCLYSGLFSCAHLWTAWGERKTMWEMRCCKCLFYLELCPIHYCLFLCVSRGIACNYQFRLETEKFEDLLMVQRWSWLKFYISNMVTMPRKVWR